MQSGRDRAGKREEGWREERERERGVEEWRESVSGSDGGWERGKEGKRGEERKGGRGGGGGARVIIYYQKGAGQACPRTLGGVGGAITLVRADGVDVGARRRQTASEGVTLGARSRWRAQTARMPGCVLPVCSTCSRSAPRRAGRKLSTLTTTRAQTVKTLARADGEGVGGASFQALDTNTVQPNTNECSMVLIT